MQAQVDVAQFKGATLVRSTKGGASSGLPIYRGFWFTGAIGFDFFGFKEVAVTSKAFIDTLLDLWCFLVPVEYPGATESPYSGGGGSGAEEAAMLGLREASKRWLHSLAARFVLACFVKAAKWKAGL